MFSQTLRRTPWQRCRRRCPSALGLSKNATIGRPTLLRDVPIGGQPPLSMRPPRDAEVVDALSGCGPALVKRNKPKAQRISDHRPSCHRCHVSAMLLPGAKLLLCCSRLFSRFQWSSCRSAMRNAAQKPLTGRRWRPNQRRRTGGRRANGRPPTPRDDRQRLGEARGINTATKPEWQWRRGSAPRARTDGPSPPPPLSGGVPSCGRASAPECGAPPARLHAAPSNLPHPAHSEQ